jgi:Ca2+-binding EF-hand superfamily protein
MSSTTCTRKSGCTCLVCENATKVEEGVTSMLASIDKDGDGEISKEECADAGHSAEQVEAIFEKVDADGDGKLSKEEMVASGLKDAEVAAAAAAAATADGGSASDVKEEPPAAPSTVSEDSTDYTAEAAPAEKGGTDAGADAAAVVEPKTMVAAEGQVLDNAEAAEAMTAIDTDGDGIINKEDEFAAFLNNGSSEGALKKMQAVTRGNTTRATQRKQKDAATKLQALLRGARARIPQAEVDERFATADADGSGGIDVEELKAMAAAEGQVLDNAEAAEVMTAIDTDGNGIIDKEEVSLTVRS